MRLISFLNKYRVTGFILVCIFCTGILHAQENAETKIKAIKVALKVADDTGKPISDATVVVGEGILHLVTNQSGEVAFEALPTDFVSVSYPEFERKVLLVSELTNDSKVSLVRSKLFMTTDDQIPMPFMTITKRHLTGSYNTIKGNLLEKYPSTDIRNSFTGLASGLDVREFDGSPGISAEEELAVFGIGEKVNISARGRNMRYIIDEIPTDITEMPLDPNEIESVTIIKDIVGKSMYGPSGADGIIFIKTKRGRINERILNVNAEYGISSVDRMPEFVSGADYARLNNIARTNSGLAPLYSDAAITEYEKNDPYNKFYPSVNFKDMILKNTMNYQRVNISSTGGNDRVQYFSYLGYSGEGDIYKIGAPADYNRLNARSNIDIKINDFLSATFDFFGGLSFRRSSNYGWDADFTSEDAATNPVLSITELPSLLNDINSIPPIAFPVYANNDPKLKYPWYGVSANYNTNPIGNMTKNGYYNESGRNGTFSVALDYDMNSLVKGLKSRTYVGFNAFNLVRIGKAEQYTAYRATPSNINGRDTILLTRSYDGVDIGSQSTLHDFYYQRFAVYENLSYHNTFGKNDLQTSLTYYLSKVSRNGIEEPQRQMNTILSAIYSFDDKYNIQGVVNYAGSSSFSQDARYFLSPTIGASWIVSEEGFLKDSKLINYLKLRAEYGVLGYESFRGPFGYRDRWNTNTSGVLFGPFTSNQWFGSNTETTVYRTVQSRTGNPDLGWETRKEFNAGIDMLLANRKLLVELNYYNQMRDGMIAGLAKLPLVVGISSWLPAFNYNQVRYTGVEASLQYTKNKGDFKYNVAGHASLPKSVNVKVDELDYRYDYQKRTGEDVDAIRGQTYLGRFTSVEETKIVPQLFDESLTAGDLKYKDMNGDGVVDNNDESKIGNSSPRLLYALDIRLSYKNVELTAIGTGRAFYQIGFTNRYFTNGSGDNTYSKFVLDNVMNNGTDYPRLTYYRVNNNFVLSKYWLRDGGFFKIQNVELAWNVPVAKMHWGVRGMKVFARGANLYTFSKIKDVDPESTSSGVSNYPLFRTVTGGVKLTF